MTTLEILDIFVVVSGPILMFLAFRNVVRQVQAGDRNWVRAANNISWGTYWITNTILHLLRTPWLTAHTLTVLKILVIGLSVIAMLFAFEILWTKSADSELAKSVDK